MRPLTTLLLLICLSAFATNALADVIKPVKKPVPAAKVVKAVAAKHQAKRSAKAASAPVTIVRPEAVKLVTITGIVLGKNGLALPGASVFPAGKFQAAVVTNEEGEFSLTLPATQAASVNLTFAYAGLGDWQVRVKGGQQAPVFVTLLPKGM